MIVLSWELGCCVILASYTANLAQVLVSQNVPNAQMSAVSFDQLLTNNRKICLRDGTAIASQMTEKFNIATQQIVTKEGGLIASQNAASQDLRTGGCDGFVQPLWMAQDMLVRSSNAPCDLRIVYPSIQPTSG